MCNTLRGVGTKPISYGIPEAETTTAQTNEAQEPNNSASPPPQEEGEGVRISGIERTVDGNYSIQFEIADKNGRLCAGMYYTIKVASRSHVHNNLVTDANGMTVRIISHNKDDKVYLYIGHREESYADLPTSRSTDENIYDEYNLNNEVQDQTVAPNKEMKVAHITTQRLWQPWTPSEEIKTLIKNVIERFSPNFYDLGDGGITIGYGHFTRHSEAAEIRRQYPNGITREQADALFEKDLVRRARYKALYQLIKVPMYQHEFDALVCMRFNNPGTTEGTYGFTVTSPQARLRDQTSIKDHLNRGQYTQTGNKIPTIYNSVGGEWSKGVQNRRNCEKKIFLENIYEGW